MTSSIPKQPRILLGSGGFRDENKLQALLTAMREHFGEIEELLFIPYALIDYDGYVETFRKNVSEVIHHHRPSSIVVVVSQLSLIMCPS